MKKLRAHHLVCVSRLYDAITLFNSSQGMYFAVVKNELKRRNFLRESLLDNCKYTWGRIYSKEIMAILSDIIYERNVIFIGKRSDSICGHCYGNNNNSCIAEDRIQNMDSVASNILNITSDTVVNISRLSIDSCEADRVCFMCGTYSKCSLIREAVCHYMQVV